MKERVHPSLEEAGRYARDYRCVPLSRTILSDSRTPVEVLRALKAVSRHCFILESLEDSARWGRYTFLGYDPKLEFTCLDGTVRIRSGTTVTIPDADPAAYIRQIAAENRSPRLKGLPPFTGGLMGYFAYDAVKYAEPTLDLDAEDEERFNDIDLMLFDKIIAFDHLRQTVTMIVNISTDELEENYRAACLELDTMEALIRRGAPADNPPLRLKSDFTPLFDRERYCAMVERTKHYIFEGDIFQAVISNRLEAEAEGSLLDTYRLLRARNPSPYMFYIASDSLEIAGSSPETLVKLEDGVLHTYPLAGTRPRGKTEAEDKALAYIARKADGGLRDAISLFDQCIAYRGSGVLSYEKALEALGTVDSDMLSRSLRAMLTDDTSEALKLIEAVRIEGRDLSQFVQDFIWYLRNLLLLMTAEATGDLLEMSAEDWMRLAEEAKLTDPEDLMRLIRLFSSVFNEMRAAADKRVLLEVAAIKATRPAMETDISALSARVLDLEQKLENAAYLPRPAAPQTQDGTEPKKTSQDEAERVIPRADWENLQEIRKRWKQLLRRIPRQAAWPLEFTWIEPKDGGVMSIVFHDRFKYNTALKFDSVALLQRALEKEYGRAVAFDVRVAGTGETAPRFVTDEELAAIPMEIETED